MSNLKSFLTVFFCMVSLHLLAQLSVRNNAYMFVNDQVVYVEDNVNIQETTANIYLRNQAQLIQGSGVTGNSGLGELSTQQEGTVNRYAYNYWCSPIGNVDSNFNGNADFRADLIDESTGLVSSVDASFTNNYNSSTSPLTISNYWIYTFVASSSYSQWNYVGQSGDIAPGLGFSMKGVGTASTGNQMYDFRGKPNNGTMANTVANAQQTLVGNPYPSALDAYEFIHDPVNSANITGVLYYWEQQPGQASHFIADYVGGYATYTIDASYVESFVKATFLTYLQDGNPTGLPGTTSPTSKQARRYIPIGQGFMVEGTASGTVRTTNDMRSYYKESDVDSEFFRNSSASTDSTSATVSYAAENAMTVPATYKRFRIYTDFDDLYTRELLMNLNDNATPGFDYGMEAKSPEDVASDAYWILNGEPYVIQAFAYDIGLHIPLVVQLNTQKSLRIRIHDIQNFDASQPIYLHDMDTGLYTDLRQQNFEITLDAGNYTNRFEITFQNQTLGLEEINESDLTVFQNNTSAELTIKNPNLFHIKQITLFDITGKQILNEVKLPQGSEYIFSTKKLSEGTYIVKVILDTNQNMAKKVVVSNK